MSKMYVFSEVLELQLYIHFMIFFYAFLMCVLRFTMFVESSCELYQILIVLDTRCICASLLIYYH